MLATTGGQRKPGEWGGVLLTPGKGWYFTPKMFWLLLLFVLTRLRGILSPTEELKEKLTEYVDKVNGQKPGFIKVVRHSKQEGLIRSRVSGWRAATAPVVALFDAHVEFNVGW